MVDPDWRITGGDSQQSGQSPVVAIHTKRSQCPGNMGQEDLLDMCGLFGKLSFFIVKGPVPVLFCYRRCCCGCGCYCLCSSFFLNLTHNHGFQFVLREHRNFKLAGDPLLEM